MPLKKRSPCVGICSTTYGDLVCRGCKRFAHEVVAWNSYDDAQRHLIWNRLSTLRDEVVDQNVCILHPQQYERACRLANNKTPHEFDGEEQTPTQQVYSLLQYMVKSSRTLEWAGLITLLEEIDALSVLQKIDAEIYRRSVAHYERNFKIPV